MFAAAGAAQRRRPATGLAYRRDPAAAGGPHRQARLLRHPYRKRADRNPAPHAAHRFQVAGIGVPSGTGARRAATRPALGNRYAPKPLRTQGPDPSVDRFWATGHNVGSHLCRLPRHTPNDPSSGTGRRGNHLRILSQIRGGESVPLRTVAPKSASPSAHLVGMTTGWTERSGFVAHMPMSFARCWAARLPYPPADSRRPAARD